MTALAFTPPGPRMTGVTPRVGSPRRAAILTALAAAAVRDGNLRAVLVLARTGRPRSLIRCAGAFRWLALAALSRLYPEANDGALRAALGCRAAETRTARAVLRETWPDDAIEAVAQDVIDNEDAQLTAGWIWPAACAIAAGHTGADAAAVQTATGSRATQPRPVSQARRLAVYLTMTEGDVNATAMAAATGLDKNTVRVAVAAIEDRRDADADLDATIETLAEALRVRLDEELRTW